MSRSEYAKMAIPKSNINANTHLFRRDMQFTLFCLLRIELPPDFGEVFLRVTVGGSETLLVPMCQCCWIMWQALKRAFISS